MCKPKSNGCSISVRPKFNLKTNMAKNFRYKALNQPEWVPEWSFVFLAVVNTGVSVIEGMGLSLFASKQEVFNAATWTPLFLALTLYKTAFFAYILSLLYFVQILLVSTWCGYAYIIINKTYQTSTTIVIYH